MNELPEQVPTLIQGNGSTWKIRIIEFFVTSVVVAHMHPETTSAYAYT